MVAEYSNPGGVIDIPEVTSAICGACGDVITVWMEFYNLTEKNGGKSKRNDLIDTDR